MTSIPWQGADRRDSSPINQLQRACNTVFLFFLNPVLDPENNRISGTRGLAWILVWVDTLDILKSHSLVELHLTKGTVDALDWHNIALYALAFGVWFGPKGMQWMVDLVRAWKGRGEENR